MLNLQCLLEIERLAVHNKTLYICVVAGIKTSMHVHLYHVHGSYLKRTNTLIKAGIQYFHYVCLKFSAILDAI